MKNLILLLIVLGFAVNAHGTMLINYSWEDDGTVLDVYPDPELPSIIATNVGSKEGHPVHQSYDEGFWEHPIPFTPLWEPSRFSDLTP